MCVMQPLRLTLTNLPGPLLLDVPNHPADLRVWESEQLVDGCSELLIDQDDFREEANKHFKRLVLGKRVRLRGGLSDRGRSLRERCRRQGHRPSLLARCVTSVPGADPEDGLKPKGVIQWVSADAAAFPRRSGATTGYLRARAGTRAGRCWRR